MEAAGEDGVRDIASPGEITLEALREVHPGWRISERDGRWRAVRAGPYAMSGPESLLLRRITAPDLPGLARRLRLQVLIDSLDPGELAAVYQAMSLPGAPR